MTGLRHRLHQIRKLISVLRSPAAWRALVSWKPFSITAFRMMQTLEILVPELRTIVDVGANQGQFSRAAAETYPNVEIFAFEPLPDVSETLRRNLSDLTNVRIDPRAVGSANGALTFHRYDYSLESSPLPRLPDRPHSSNSRTVGGHTLEVPVTRLDEALSPDELKTPCLLKLDVQGFELEVLDGADKLLPSLDYILVETSFREVYENQPLFDDIYTHLTDRGFHLIAPVDMLTDPTGVITQIDALFQQT